MTNINTTHITLVLDRSGSMSGIWDDTLGGLNSFVEEQKKLPGKATFTLHWFDTHHEWPYDAVDLKQVKTVTREQVMPRGMTALLDAIGTEIDRTGAKLAALPEDQRPGKVLFVIMTDGGENSSCILEEDAKPSVTISNVGAGCVQGIGHAMGVLNPMPFAAPKVLKYANDKLAKMIEHQKTAYSWQFIFLGANQDAFSVAQGLNINAAQTMNYASNSAGTARAFDSVSKVASGYRLWNGIGGQSVATASSSFDAEDKQWQKDAGTDNPT